jgi:nitric oxide reductase activation protein
VRFHALADLADAAACRRIASVLANELGQMRVPFDAQQPYVVPVAYRDDNSYLWTFDKTAADTTATITLDMEPPAMPAAADTAHAPQDVQPDPQPTATYPEWDHRMGRLRQSWCTVCERPAPLDAMTPPASRLRNAHLAAARQRTPAQSRPSRDGDTPHLDAAIAALLDLRLHSTPPDAVFVRDAARRTRRDDASVLVLLDLSESTNDAFDERPASGSHTPGPAGPTVLALEKEAARQLASRHTARGARVAVHGFHSHTRADVGYYCLLDFGQPLDAAALQRIASVRASLSTRTGAALRHATAYLAHERSRQRSILLVSDGAPSDVDVFASGQLAQDASHAMQEARRQGIAVRCLAIGAEAGRALRRMAGSSAVATVTSPRALAGQLTRW